VSLSSVLIESLDAIDERARGGAVSIGNFDGVHLGHAAIVKALVESSRRLGGPAVVFTFHPHPLAVVAADRAPTPLMWPARKAALLAELGVDSVVMCPADRDLLALEPERFFRAVLVEKLQARGVVEGPNFRFGKNRSGDRETLERLCRDHQMELVICSPVQDAGGIVSSSRIREWIAHGEIAKANDRMVAPYRICGRVVRGAGRGRSLGFPTANLTSIPVLVPAVGVYAGRAWVGGDMFPAAIHIGPNPTFGEHERKVEVHLIDVEEELEGAEIEVEFIRRLRGVQSFASAEELCRQLEQDVAAARRLAAADHNEKGAGDGHDG